MLIKETKKSEENITVIDKKTTITDATGKVSAALLLASLLSLTACGSDSGTSVPGIGSSGGGSTACVDVSGEPDIMGAISFTPATADSTVSVTTVTMHIPVDADTQYVGVVLNSPDFLTSGGAITTGVDGFVAVATPGVQTLDIPVDVSSISPATGNIYPSITLCTTDINTCKQRAGFGGVAVSYATIKTSSGFVLTRFKNFENDVIITPTVDQLINPPLACVATQALAMAPAP